LWRQTGVSGRISNDTKVQAGGFVPGAVRLQHWTDVIGERAEGNRFVMAVAGAESLSFDTKLETEGWRHTGIGRRRAANTRGKGSDKTWRVWDWSDIGKECVFFTNQQRGL